MPQQPTPREQIALHQWIGCRYSDAQQLYFDFGKPEWFSELVQRFVSAVEAGRVAPDIEYPDMEFMEWAAYDLGLRRPSLLRDATFHARLEKLLPRWRHWTPT